MNTDSSLIGNGGRPLRIAGLFILVCAGGLFLLQYGSAASSAILRNLGWINLNAYLRDNAASESALAKGVHRFSQAVETSSNDESAWLGLGLSYAEQGDVDSAVTAWSQSGIDPATLITYGLSARGAGDMDAALAFLRAADALNSSEGYMLAGTVCQRIFAERHLLGQSNEQYCSDFLANNQNNLFVNGDFAAGALYGWEGHHFFSGSNAARLRIQDQGQPGNFAVSLTGQNDTNHFGLYQQLKLTQGDTVRFSGRFKTAGAENLVARLLYIGWQEEDGTKQGNHGALQSGQMEWTEFERTFRVPETAEPIINFYPVTFSGEGSVWFDDIQLEILPD